ncbi:VIT1/CCC1 transporter family protein [Aestuariivirga sp.]|uniref:VIT1/CCC1 transporter family protein n=1 Tax=Aestuariivirga sp. TaxID=2650926 RepID=UPI003BA9B123
MNTEVNPTRKAVLQPIERLSEILFGLIMVLTFTGSLSVATADRGEVKVMLIGALGCNIAWGLIDAIMYLMACLHERGAELQTMIAIGKAKTPYDAYAEIRRSVPRVVADELRLDILERIRLRVAALSTNAHSPRPTVEDLRGAFGVFLIVVISTLPVVLPFVFVADLARAMRWSNAVAVIMLALIGYYFGRASGLSPWWTALSMVLLGSVLVSLTIVLGG